MRRIAFLTNCRSCLSNCRLKIRRLIPNNCWDLFSGMIRNLFSSMMCRSFAEFCFNLLRRHIKIQFGLRIFLVAVCILMLIVGNIGPSGRKCFWILLCPLEISILWKPISLLRKVWGTISDLRSWRISFSVRGVGRRFLSRRGWS